MVNAETKIEAPDNVHRKLAAARKAFHALELKKSGRNTFANYSYFELGDFLLPAMSVLFEHGLGTTPATFDGEFARMDIVNLDDPSDILPVRSPMGSAALKGCHEVQNIGAVQTYQRRYLWVNAMEIVEHDALDATTGKGGSQNKVNPYGMPDHIKTKIIQLCEAVGGNQTSAICNAYSVGEIGDLSKSQADSVIERLEKKLAAKSKEKADA